MNVKARLLPVAVIVFLLLAAVSASAANPILVITKTTNPFSTYLPEILRSEGMNSFDVADISSVSDATLAGYDLAVVGEMTLTPAQVTMFTNWVNGGGNLIAMRPDPQLATLVGVAGPSGTLADKYLAVNTSAGPGAGIVSATIQFHGTADLYASNGATAIATLYSNATAATTSPAVTLRNAGSGKVAAFTYDLARSVVYTRQGNPAWSGQERDGTTPIRSDDLFFGAKTGDVQADWVDLNKVAIPQADEQQRLLVNLMISMSQSKKPLPRFWYFPKGVKAAVVMTGDDHGSGATGPRFDQFVAASPTGCSVADWECIRGTSYVYPSTPITNPTNYVNQGFEIGLHVSTSCGDFFGFSDLDSYFQTQLPQFASAYPGVPAPKTNRTHCIAFSDYDTEPQVELSHGIRFDTNYYYWPGSWVNDRPGMFTGSGIPQRFMTSAGSLIDVYQATSQMTDESNQSFPGTINALLNNAYNGSEYYGAFTANMHTDSQSGNSALWAGQIVSAAKALGVPVVSSLQMLQWLDGKNGSTFNITSWSGNVLSFSVTAASGARNLRAMLPTNFGAVGLTSIMQGATAVSYTKQTINGVQYAMFPATTGSYTATYGGGVTFSISGSVTPVPAGTTTMTATGPVSATATADSFGNYVFNGLPAGTYTITPSNPKADFLPVSQQATVVSDNLYGINFTSTSACPCSLWTDTTQPSVASVNDPSAVELGVRFRPDANGTITGIRFYKGTNNTGTHSGSLWTTSGTLLATANFVNETATGWQTVTFAQPVTVTANTYYIASYHTNAGNYAADDGYFAAAVDNTPLHAPADTVSAPNGLYRYGSTSGFPTNTYHSANYWVDVVFMRSQSSYGISGTVSGPGNSGVTVNLSGAATASTTTNTSGNYSFSSLQNGSYTVTPSKAGSTFSPASQNVTINGASATANFISSLITYTISGTVSGVVSSGVTINLGGTANATTTTDASGNYTFTGVVSGTYSVTASLAGYVFTPPTQNTTVSGANVTGVNFTSAVQTFSISGTITGSGASGATVTLSGASSATTTSNASGAFSFAGLANGAYTVTPTKAAVVFTPASQNVTISGANVTAVNFSSVAQTYVVSGTITGAGASGATVTVTGSSSATTTTDASGNFSFNLTNGSYTLTPTKAGYTFTPVNQAVTVNGAAVTGLSFSSAVNSGGGTTYSIWSASAVPAVAAANDSSAVELGVRFKSDVNGTITGIRFYKASSNTGTHTGSLWSNTGTRLATATFSNETASGWQQVTFATPVTITANTTYVASYHTNVGKYAADANYFAAGVDNAPLHALSNAVAGGNGTYVYGAGGTFPGSSYQSTNYWVDVVFLPAAPTYTISGTLSGVGGTSATVALSGAASATTTSDASGNYSFTGLQNGSYTVTPSKTGVIFSPASQNVTVNGANQAAVNFTSTVPTFAVTGTVSGATVSGVTITVSGGASATATTDASGNYSVSLPTGSYTFTPSMPGYSFTPVNQAVTVNGAAVSGVNFVSATVTTHTIWNSSTVPAVANAADPSAIELGVRFRSDVNGTITGIRFYKGPTNTGTHTASLWSSTGTLLATATFANETASGWQQVTFATPVSITANTVYVASYHTNAGNYSVDQDYFATVGVDNAPLHALPTGTTGNGTYVYGAGGVFPGSTYRASNYWVDVVMTTP